MGIIIANVIRVYQTVLFIRALSSWFPDVASSEIGRFLHAITEPVLSPVRNFLFKTLNLSIPIDLSLIVVYFGLDILATIVRYI